MVDIPQLMHTRATTIVLVCALATGAWAQRIPDPQVGQQKFTRKGIMDGNLVRTIFWNHGEISDWPNQPSGEWPKGSGHSYVDGVALVVREEPEEPEAKPAPEAKP